MHADREPMHPPAIQLILDEHRALTTVLWALRACVDDARKPGRQPNFDELRAMLFFLDEMPARVHHAYESELLFPRIRERCPALRPVLDRLGAEHSRGESSVLDLEHALAAWEIMGDERREAFELMLNAYVDSYLGHMEVEENYVLPVAMDYLSEADWRELEAALAHQSGKLTETMKRDHRDLFERIVANHSPD
jgi:hemerythrin-like domain-containing protein